MSSTFFVLNCLRHLKEATKAPLQSHHCGRCHWRETILLDLSPFEQERKRNTHQALWKDPQLQHFHHPCWMKNLGFSIFNSRLKFTFFTIWGTETLSWYAFNWHLMENKKMSHWVKVFYGFRLCVQLYRQSFWIIIFDINYSLEIKQFLVPNITERLHKPWINTRNHTMCWWSFT